MINPFGFDDEDYEVKAGCLIDEHTFANAFLKVTWLLERHWTVIKQILDEPWSRLPHDVRDESADGSENDATHRSGTYLPHTFASASMALIEYASSSIFECKHQHVFLFFCSRKPPMAEVDSDGERRKGARRRRRRGFGE